MPDAVVAVLRLSKLELGVLLALTKLGMDAWRDGDTGELAAILDNVPKAIFNGLADKIKNAAQSEEADA